MPKVLKKKKITVSQLKDKLWELCKQIVRKRYITKDSKWYCFTCGRLIDEPGKAQTGHFIPSSVGGILCRYHLNNLRIQCYNCNINKSGNWPAYLENLTNEIGKDGVDELLRLKNMTAKADIIFYQQKVDEYEKILADLSTV